MQRGAAMLGLDRVLASALSEMRSVRRLVRTWMFVAVALLIGLIGYGQQVFFHAIGSGVSVTVGAMMAPRFVVAQLGTQMLWVLMVGLVFIAFDVRARDRRERVDEVLDSRPVDNVEVLLGRLLGIVLIGWLPVAVLAFVTIFLGVLARAGDWWISPGIEPLSLVSMLFVDVPASLALWVALVMFVAIVARNRLVAACVGMVLVGLHVLAFFRLPFYLVPVVVFIGDVARLPSDVAPVVPSLPSLLQRLGFLAGAGALLTFGAALHPRRDSRASGRAVAIGVGLSALAALGIGIGNVAVSVGAARERFVDWATAHRALAEVPRADVQSVSGRVAIDPGKRLAIDIEMAVTAPREPADRLLFSFNPGLAISDLRVNGEPGEFTHALGLLAIPSPEASEFTLAIRAEGSPRGRLRLPRRRLRPGHDAGLRRRCPVPAWHAAGDVRPTLRGADARHTMAAHARGERWCGRARAWPRLLQPGHRGGDPRRLVGCRPGAAAAHRRDHRYPTRPVLAGRPGRAIRRLRGAVRALQR